MNGRNFRLIVALMCVPLFLVPAMPLLHHGLDLEDQVLTLLKALSSERTVSQSHQPISIGVLYQSTNPASDSVCRQILSFDLSGLAEPYGLADVSIRAVDMSRETQWQKTVLHPGVTAVIVTSVDESVLPEITAFCREHRIISMTTVESYVERGISVGVEMIDHRPILRVNLPASLNEGAHFSSRMLQLAKIIR